MMILRLEFPPTNLPSNDKKQILTEKYDDDYDDSDDDDDSADDYEVAISSIPPTNPFSLL